MILFDQNISTAESYQSPKQPHLFNKTDIINSNDLEKSIV